MRLHVALLAQDNLNADIRIQVFKSDSSRASMFAISHGISTLLSEHGAFVRIENRRFSLTCTTRLRAAPASFTSFFTLKSISAIKRRCGSSYQTDTQCLSPSLALAVLCRALYTFALLRFIFYRLLMSRVPAEWRHIIACAWRVSFIIDGDVP